jgi:hypothetical protein
MYTENELSVYYISDKEYDKHKINKKNVIAMIEVMFDYNNKSMTIINLISNIPNKQYATNLILYASMEAKKRKIKSITLDDCSDNYRTKNNIYSNIGMVYEDDITGPEMIGSVNIISKYKTNSITPVIYSLLL